MKIFMRRKDMLVSVVNNRIIYVFDEKDATNFANTTVESFIKMKKELEEREGMELELEFA